MTGSCRSIRQSIHSKMKPFLDFKAAIFATLAMILCIKTSKISSKTIDHPGLAVKNNNNSNTNSKQPS